MMNESSFAITDKAVKFTVSYTNAGYSENFSATLWYSFDRENNKIYMSWNVDSKTNYGNPDIFLYMDIDCDFSDGSLLSFHIKTLQESTQNTAAFSYKYSGRELTAWHDTQGDYLAYFEPERSALDAMIPDAVNLNANYTAAYTKAMNRMNSVA